METSQTRLLVLIVNNIILIQEACAASITIDVMSTAQKHPAHPGCSCDF